MDLIGIFRWRLTHYLEIFDCQEHSKRLEKFFNEFMEVHLPSYFKYSINVNPPTQWNNLEYWKFSNL